MQQASATVGVCGLCQNENVQLCYSDLLPKAVMRWVRITAHPAQGNPNPVFVTPNATKQMNYRVAEYLLCSECEDRLNKGGETWTLRNTYRGTDVFPLRDFLQGAPPRYALSEAMVIDATPLRQIDLPKLLYFAISVFWRAGACQWWAIDHPTRLSLGPYETSFRKFLLGDQPFPDRAALVISISGNPAPLIGAIYPYDGGRNQGTRQYRFTIPGMAFWLHLGQITEGLRGLCAFHAGVLCLAADLNETFMRDVGSLVAASGQSRKRRNRATPGLKRSR